MVLTLEIDLSTLASLDAEIQVLSFRNVMMVISNCLLLVSNVVIMFDGLKLNSDNSVDQYISMFLGFGVFAAYLCVSSTFSDYQDLSIVSVWLI